MKVRTNESEESLLMSGRDFESRPDGAYVEEQKAEPERVIRFTLCSERLPEKSGIYLCIPESGGFTDMVYSSVHKAFNAVDWQKTPEHAIQVKAWAEIPAWAKEVKT